ncbi:tubulin--tyrosine ligase-like protein 12 isoform X2 [Ptychodera flava]|uniref:tubulin--tyrosine ligase-like protein 12 isoform X2 n=1 Tax=Ptychodera flava TaxID=63121 RepID=UPI003969D996
MTTIGESDSEDGATRREESFEDFLSCHQVQLEKAGVPHVFWKSLFLKLKNEVYDAGRMFMMVQAIAEEELEDNKDNDNDDGSEDVQCQPGNPEVVPLKVVVSNENGLDADDPSNIYLIDHAWTYRIEKVRQQLEEIQGLAERMVALMHLDTVNKDRNDVIELVIQEMWKYNQTYSIQNQEFSAEDKLPVWYIMDEFGSHIRHSDQPTFKTAPLFYMPNQICYTILWPVKDMDYADEVTRDFASEVRDPVLRKIRLSPWQPADFTSINTKHLELDIEYYRGVCNENWASEEELDESLLQPQRNKVNKVYTNNEQVLNFLKHPNFEIVETEEEADILWYMEHFKEFKTLALNTKKYVNQFPCESLLTTKDMLARTARRASPSDQDGPKWLAKTFDLLQELPQFVSYYQQKQQSGEDNIWICKCWNLSRSLGHTVTDNLSEIIRLTETNYPQIACEYISDPVLFYRDNVGQVKMDLCYTVFLASVKPVKLFLHRNFSLRFAYKPFSLDHFDDYGKHFTVMNYADSKKLLQNSRTRKLTCVLVCDQQRSRQKSRCKDKSLMSIYCNLYRTDTHLI